MLTALVVADLRDLVRHSIRAVCPSVLERDLSDGTHIECAAALGSRTR